MTIAKLFARATLNIDVQKLLEWGFLEILLQSSLSFSDNLEIMRYALKAVLYILSFQNERISIVNKMSEFEFERLFDNAHDDFPEEYGEHESIVFFIREIQRNLESEL